MTNDLTILAKDMETINGFLENAPDDREWSDEELDLLDTLRREAITMQRNTEAVLGQHD